MRTHQRIDPGKGTRDLTVRELLERAGLDISVEDFSDQVDLVVRYGPHGAAVLVEPKSEFDPFTRAALLRAGADFSPLGAERPDPVDVTRALFVAILADSDTPEVVAARLARDISRVRQRVRDRTLWALAADPGVRLPRVQFDDDGSEIAGMGSVLRALPDDLHPVSVFRWLTTPVAELTAPGEGDVPLSPRDWLRSGGGPEAAIEVARDLLVA
jgi:hypothetical protein